MKLSTLNPYLYSCLMAGVLLLSSCEDNKSDTPTPTTTEYTVTFDAGTGGTLTSTATVKVKSGEKVAEPTAPTRDGFTFSEWQTADGAAFDFATQTITEDITLTAKWVSNTKYTVTFDLMGGTFASGTNTVQVPDGEKLTEPTAPTKVGSTFAGWQTADGAADGTAFNFDTQTITADITLTAQWTLEYHSLADSTDATSPLRQWMQRATTNAHTDPANQWFTRGSGGFNATPPPGYENLTTVAVHINESTFTIISFGMLIPTAVGIPATAENNNDQKTLGFTDLFGTGKTADGYAVSEDTLYITQSGTNTPTTLATMVINSVGKGLFVKAGQAAGLLLPSDNDQVALNNLEWIARAGLATGAYEGISSTSGNVGVGSTLTFDPLSNRPAFDIVFAQSAMDANAISDINNGAIAGTGNTDQWPNVSILDLPGYGGPCFGLENELFFYSAGGPGVSAIFLMGITFPSPNGDIKVTYLPARNSDNPAEKVTVTYRRPSNE